MLINSNETTYMSLFHSSPSKTETGHARFIPAATMVRGSEPMSETPNSPLVHLHKDAPEVGWAGREDAETLMQRRLEGAPRGACQGWEGAQQQDRLGARALVSGFRWGFGKAVFYMRLSLYM